MGSAKNCLLILFILTVAGCGGMIEDLAPSGRDQRPAVIPGTSGPHVGQNAPDFTLPDTLGGSFTLSSVVTTTGVRGAVFYFTMWCPICDSHQMNMLTYVLPSYPDVRFFLVDYVSGSVADAANAELTSGYWGSGFTVLADVDQSVLNLYQATMGITVVVDTTGIVRMNEDYKDGVRLQNVLAGLP
jgi:peroxiredoxin